MYFGGEWKHEGSDLCACVDASPSMCLEVPEGMSVLNPENGLVNRRCSLGPHSPLPLGDTGGCCITLPCSVPVTEQVVSVLEHSEIQACRGFVVSLSGLKISGSEQNEK